MFDADTVIRQLLEARRATEIRFDDGSSSVLRPARYVPALDGSAARVSLDGAWTVRRWPFDADEAELAGPGVSDASWEQFPQPGKIFYQDPDARPADVKDWHRVRLTHIDPDDGAVLRRRVEVPADWSRKRIFLRFGAIYPAGRVYLNGALLGEHTSGLTPVEWDVTDLVTPGEPVLVAVRLLRKHPYVDLDMPRHAMEFAGLAQEAFLHATEPCHVRDFALPATLEETCGRGTVAGSVTVTNEGEVPAEATLRAELLAPDGKVAASFEEGSRVGPGDSAELPVRLEVHSPALWSDESPSLYTARLRLAVPGQVDQTVTWRAGFRRLDLDGGRPRLNGGFIKFRGVNHLTFHPEGGLYTPKPWLRRCFELMKRANVNAIRTHFLAPPAVAELCDEMGFYLLQELPMDWAAHHLDGRACLGEVLQRLEGGIRRDRHHPSVIAWSIGNENLAPHRETAEVFWSNTKLFDRLAHRLSPNIATMFPPPGPANKIKGLLETRVGDIADTHYSFRFIRQLNETAETVQPHSWEGPHEVRSRSELQAEGWTGVWFSSEWGVVNCIPDLLNAPYLSILCDEPEDPLSGKNSLQAFIDRVGREWAYMRDDPACLGGAYFPWMCAGAGDPWGWTCWGEDADWGVVTHELLPKPQFWALRVIYSPVLLPERTVWRPGQAELTLRVRNLYHRTDLSECTFRTMLGGGPPFMGQMRNWQDVPVECPPGGEAEVTVPLWSEWTMQVLEEGRPAVCRVVVLDPDGFRPITADVVIVPESLAGEGGGDIPIGPDANLADL